jgi:hypothetical protein
MNKLKLAFGLLLFALLIVLLSPDIQSWITSLSLQFNEHIEPESNTVTKIEPAPILMLGILSVWLGLHFRSNLKKNNT